MVKVILSTMLDLFSCGPCGKLKTQLQDDDADIWNDLTLAYAVPGAKPPNIPKVVKVVSDSDTDDDVSTLYESSFHNRQHNCNRRDIDIDIDIDDDDDDDEEEEEKSSFSPSLTTPRRTFNNTEMEAETTEDDCSPMYGHDLELEQVLEEIDLSEADDDESLESIMGPRSQVVSVTSSRHSRRTSSSLPVTFSPIALPLPSTRPISLLQQEREQYHGMMSDESSRLLPLSARPPSLIHQEREQYHVAMSSLRGGEEEDEKEESCSLLPLSARPPSLLQQQREKFPSIFPREDYKEEDYRDDEFFCDNNDHDHDDGSSYSSVCQKMSFFKKKMNAFPSSDGNGNGNGNGKNIMWKMSSSAITSNNSGWQILQGDSTDTSSTVQTQNRRPHHILSTLRPR
jgi:hypothetical protein